MGHGVQGRRGSRRDAVPPARLDAEGAAAVAETLQALVAPSRLLILSHLRQGPAGVSEITAAVGLEQSAVSHQLRLLRMMGLVTPSRAGRTVTYALFDDHVAALLDEAVYHAEHLRLGVPDPASAPDAMAGRVADVARVAPFAGESDVALDALDAPAPRRRARASRGSGAARTG